MFRLVHRQGRGLLVLLAAIAIALSACGGSSTTAAPGSTGATSIGATSTGATSTGSGLSGAASAFSTIDSYKFSMTLAGDGFGSTLSMLGGPSAWGNAPFTLSGTVTVRPENAADISMAGFHIVQIGGYDYLDLGGTGSFVETAVSGTGTTDSLSPSQLFSKAIDPSVISGYNKVGSETKNGVDTDHYQASASALAEYGSMLDVTGATWTADVWIAQDGGYPVSLSILARASDNSIVYEVLFDITNVNDSANRVTAPIKVTAPTNVATPTSAWTLDTAGPTPAGMLPLGPTTSHNQPPGPCTPGIPIGISRPILYEALSADQLSADPRPSAVGEIVNYDWAGHRPVAADSLHITAPALAWTLRPRAALMRMVLATSDGVCFAEWRVAARPLAGYDGAQESGSSWSLLGQGSTQTDATVIEGLPEGDWILHVHLAFAPAGTTPSHTSESYARVVVGNQLAVQPPVVPAPEPAADCASQTLQSGLNPEIELAVAGMYSTRMGVHGTVPTGHGGALLPAEMPDPPIPTHPGSQITIRTEDGTCGNDWGGFTFLAVPDALNGPFAADSGLPTNDGSDPNVSTPQMVRGMIGLAPAPGEWLLTVTFWFGGPEAATYYWRISVT